MMVPWVHHGSGVHTDTGSTSTEDVGLIPTEKTCLAPEQGKHAGQGWLAHCRPYYQVSIDLLPLCNVCAT